ncbi:MAG: hypothetical protein CM15mL4_0060 [uncultured marine virus]|nr:MAG: hypothetical protein CM15mL4_0060 [uncultured marine virus]
MGLKMGSWGWTKKILKNRKALKFLIKRQRMGFLRSEKTEKKKENLGKTPKPRKEPSDDNENLGG